MRKWSCMWITECTCFRQRFEIIGIKNYISIETDGDVVF